MSGFKQCIINGIKEGLISESQGKRFLSIQKEFN